MCSPKEMVAMTGNGPAGSTSSEEEPALSRQQEPGTSQPAEDPGYLIQTGEAAGEDGSVVPIIGGLPAVEGSAWDIGAPLDDRGANLADEQGGRPDQDAPSS
jgi:hypothetical protein